MRQTHAGSAVTALCIASFTGFATAASRAELASAMLADAAERPSLARAAGGAGYDEAFFLEDADGRFRLELAGQIEVRYVATLVDDDGGTAEDGFVGGFELPTVELELSGHLLDPRLVFGIEGEFEGDEDGAFVLQEYAIGYEWDEGVSLGLGQVQLPVLWEDVLDGEDALAADVSVVAGIFAPGDAQAIWLEATGDRTRGWIGFGFGAESENLPFDQSPAEYALTGRAELLLAGEWDELDSMSSMPGSGLAAKLGIAGHWQENRDRPGEDEAAPRPWGVDLQVKSDGWNLYAACVGRILDAGHGAQDFHDLGLVLQGGVFLPETDVELFARYDLVLPDGDRIDDDAFGTLTAGLNWFVPGGPARLTVDVQYFLDDTTGNELVRDFVEDDGPGLGLLASDEPGRVTLRAQLRLAF